AALAARAALHLYPSGAVLGVEVAGAMSNVAAIAAGMADGLDLGETARGLLLMRGLHEATLLGCALGADPATFAGLAGVGDLVPRRVSSTFRHRDLGTKVARGIPLAEALVTAQGHVEGVTTAREAQERAHVLGLRLPLVNAVSQVLLGDAEPKQQLEAVLAESFDLGATLTRRAS
ncbi:MAG: NAD(P)H-dependent glycerol-3-phosphate dehydrogenase, partial [Myxococcota bacterium]